jgi:hypothetical protein
VEVFLVRDERFYSQRYDLAFQREIWEYAIRRTTAMYPIARRDPIFTPLFTAVFSGVGLTGTALNVAVGLSTAIATTALTIGIQAMMMPEPPKPENGKFPLQQAIPYRIWGVGRNRSAGAFMLFETSENEVTAYMVQALRAHRIRSVNRFWLHDDEVTVKPNGYVNGLNKRYASDSTRIQWRLGLPVEAAYSDAVSRFSSIGLWTNNHRGDGQASLFIRASATRAKNQQKRFPYGIPMLSVESDDAFCWDFRDPTQSPTNPSTWKWTQNSAVICAWHLCFNEFGFRLDYRKALLPVLDLWREEADICDEDVLNAGGGTHKRYQCNGYDTTENGPKSGLNAILATCDGHLAARGDGARILTVGKFRESRVVTLTDADIVGHQIQEDVPFDEEINRLVPKFTYPATDYSTTDTDFYEDTGRQLASGRVLPKEANYQWCHDWRQARMLGKRDWLRILEKARGTLNVRTSGINAVYARWVRLATPLRLPRLNGKLIENRSSVFAPTKGGFSMEFVKHPDNIDSWNEKIDEGQQPPVPNKPNVVGILTPVINLVQARRSGQSVYIRIVIIDPEVEAYTPIVRYRVADRGDGQPGAWVEQDFPGAEPDGGFISVNTNIVPNDVLLDIQVAYKDSGGSYGDWSVTASLTSTSDTTRPAPPVRYSAQNSAVTVPVTATAANDNTRYLVFKRSSTSQSFEQATLLARYNVSANQSISFSDAPAPGTYRYWFASENVSGLQSATQPSVTTIVT